MHFAPIALFTYNRLAHTRQTVEALQQNELADKSSLFIFSDGPRSDADRASVREVREYAKTIGGFQKVVLIERERNLGLAHSIISAVTEIVNAHGRIIVLEDDLVTSKYFLQYMNQALTVYEKEERVMHISGSAYPIDDFSADDTYFLHIPLCWGWGTWKRAWDRFSKNFEMMEKFDRSMKERFNFDGTYPYWKQLEMNRNGQLNTWFVFWYATVFLRNGLVLFPKKALVKNIGHDGTGVHCGRSDAFDVELSLQPVKVLPIPLKESQEALRMHKEYFRRINARSYLGIFHKIMRVAKRLFQ
jgi:GT2 family glycosyltransferase